MDKFDSYINEFNKIRETIIQEKLNLNNPHIIDHIDKLIIQAENAKNSNPKDLENALNNLTDAFKGLHSVLYDEKNE